MRTAYRNYLVNGLLVIGAATYLPHLGDQIATATGLGETFVGTTLIALTTTLPELVVSIAALRIDVTDLIYGNLLGSNLFNMAILALDDLLYCKRRCSPPPSEPCGDRQRRHGNDRNRSNRSDLPGEQKKVLFAWDSLAIVAVYLCAVSVVYLMR